MRVDHARAARRARRSAGRAARAASIPVAATVAVRSATLSQARSSGWPSASRIAARGLREVRRERDRGDAQPVGELVERPVELVGARLVLRELPRLASARRSGSAGGRSPRSRRARPVMSKRSSAAGTSSRSAARRAAASSRARIACVAQPAVPVARDHRGRPREQVAEVVAELALVALVEAVERDVCRPARTATARAAQKRTASAPYTSIRSSGSITLPSDFEIFGSSRLQVPVDEELLRHLVARPTSSSAGQ